MNIVGGILPTLLMSVKGQRWQGRGAGNCTNKVAQEQGCQCVKIYLISVCLHFQENTQQASFLSEALLSH